MQEEQTPGTEGYNEVSLQFIEATIAIKFRDLYADFVPFFPSKAGHVLDIGAGIGRDAYEFSQMGHKVTAVEPLSSFLNTAKELFDSPRISWLNDALPELKSLENSTETYDFILASGVWHHLSPEEQFSSLKKLAGYLNPNGIFALSLRNGPASADTHIYPTNGAQTIKHAEQLGLKTLLFLENQPGLMKNKENVLWTKVVLQK